MLALLTTARTSGDNEQCHDISTDPRFPSNTIYINNSIIGIPHQNEVEIRCECLVQRVFPEWCYNDNSITASTQNDSEEFSPYIETNGQVRATLRIESFEEQSSGLYTCNSRDTTEIFNLIWYDPGKFLNVYTESYVNYNINSN